MKKVKKIHKVEKKTETKEPVTEKKFYPVPYPPDSQLQILEIMREHKEPVTVKQVWDALPQQITQGALYVLITRLKASGLICLSGFSSLGVRKEQKYKITDDGYQALAMRHSGNYKIVKMMVPEGD